MNQLSRASSDAAPGSLLLCALSLGALGLPAAGLLCPASASADFDDWSEVNVYTSSPEHFGLELRVGVYYPTGLGDSFASESYFGSDVGPMLDFELHYFPVRIPYLGLVGGGGGLGWSQWDTSAPGGVQGDRNVFEMITMRPFLVWRIDTLARELNIPVVLTPKIGLDIVHWLTSTSDITEAEGWSVGARFGGKVSLELDFLEPRAARQLDEEWGINHSEILLELYYSMAGEEPGGMLPVAGWGWALGLGFTF